MTLYVIPEPAPKIQHELIDFMSTAEFEAIKAAIKDPNRPKGNR